MAQHESSRQLIVAGARLGPVPLVPEIRLHQASDPISLWQRTEAASGRTGLDPPNCWQALRALAGMAVSRARNVERSRQAWLSYPLPAAHVAWLSNDVPACRGLAVAWLIRGARALSGIPGIGRARHGRYPRSRT